MTYSAFRFASVVSLRPYNSPTQIPRYLTVTCPPPFLVKIEDHTDFHLTIYSMTSNDENLIECKMTDEHYYNLVIANPMFIRLVPPAHQTHEMYRYAAKEAPYSIQYFHTQSPDICILAVQRDGTALRFVREQTPDICHAAIIENWRALYHVREQTPDICLAAINEHPHALQYVREQTPELCRTAVNAWADALQYVHVQTRELCLVAVQQTGYAITCVREPTPEIYLAAVKQCGRVLEDIDDKTPELCLAAVKQDGLALVVVPDEFKTQELCAVAFANNPKAIRYIRNRRLLVPALMHMFNAPDQAYDPFTLVAAML
jgi:hypothetical protein